MTVDADCGGESPCLAHLLGRGRDIDDHHDIEEFVRHVSRQVAMDDLLGPIFAAAQVDWNEHIERLTAFWARQLLGEPGSVGNPLGPHRPLHQHTVFTDAHDARRVADEHAGAA